MEMSMGLYNETFTILAFESEGMGFLLESDL